MATAVTVESAAPSLGVVIVNFNGGEHVRASVASVLGQTRSADRVVVVDNGSTDGSLAALSIEFPDLEVVALGRNAGFAEANNVGIERLEGCALVALLNPDAIADGRWLEELLRSAAAHPEAASFASCVERADTPGILESAGDLYHVYGTSRPRRSGAPVSAVAAEEPVFGATGAAALYRRDWLLRVGCFDERFFCYFEDVDLNLRLQVAGGACILVPSARVRHVGGASSGGLTDFTVYHSQRNLVWAYVKSAPDHVLYRYLVLHVLLNLASIGIYTAGGHPHAVLRAKWHALKGLSPMLRSRRTTARAGDDDRARLDRILDRGFRTLVGGIRP